MKINWIGNFQAGYVGEVGDALHLTRELESLGHTVQRVPQDIWKAFCDGERNEEWINKMPMKADINIVNKWHHFTNEKYINDLRTITEAPVFYFVWDYMWDQGIPDWHIEMAKAADLYLGNDVRATAYRDLPIRSYYFPFDVADGDIQAFDTGEYDFDVVFLGSCIGQGDRIAWLTEINKTNPVTCFSWNYQEWQKRGFNAYPSHYGEDFNRVVAKSKIILGFSVNPSTWGYWSNRVGKVLLAGGFLLYQYAPGMELFLRDGVEYFSSIDEAREKIDHYLIADNERKAIASRGFYLARQRFSSRGRIKDLVILIERYLLTQGKGWIL